MKESTHPAYWVEDKLSQEISAFCLGLLVSVLSLVKTKIIPMLTADENAPDAEDHFTGYPWVWQKYLLKPYSGHDTVLAEPMAFLELCKQKASKSINIAEFETRCKYHGRRCEYGNMANPEEELIRDRFVTGVRDNKLRTELSQHNKDDRS